MEKHEVEQEQDDETKAQEENEGVKLQVLKREGEQRRGDVEISPENSLQITEDVSQVEGNKEEIWIGAGYLRTKNIHTDSGGESCGDASNKMVSIIDATRTTTAGRTPDQNGTCEGSYQTLE